MLGMLRRMFNANEREIRRLQGTVAVISDLEPEIAALDDGALQGKTTEFRQRLANGATVDSLLPEAFAVAREGATRALGLRPFDVQLMGGVVLHEGRVAEMRTGEGKTLVATLPAYLNALEGKGVHVVTVNDYLARRDSQWMGQIYRFLGMSVGVIIHDWDSPTRRHNYAADITYGTNHEFGFDYLRDNMTLDVSELTQRDLHFAIVDEVDSILIDEARTPLIISGPTEKPADLYYRFAAIVEDLVPEEDYNADEKMQTVAPTEAGIHKVERAMGVENLYDVEHMNLSHYLENALRAKALMLRDQKYIVKDGEIVLVDEFTGRLMFGRRYGHGLHEAIEAKEGCKIAQGTQTMATITYQNYFRLYKKLAGMTGTAATEEDEFHKIYKLDVVQIPTNLPMIRKDNPDLVYKSEAAKLRAVVREIKQLHASGQPVLVGTVDIDKNERLSRMLDREGVPHQLLNAKHHDKEAAIIAQAGRVGAVTIATNMAGRGTDILLGGNPEYLARQRLLQEGVPPELVDLAAERISPVLPGQDSPSGIAAAHTAVGAGAADGPPLGGTLPAGATGEQLAALRVRYQDLMSKFKLETDLEHERVVAAGGLHVLGTERHESRRIDNQLRGRSGRQGDPGSSRFYLSLEDSLMRLFGTDNLRGIMDRLGVEEDEPIESPLVTRAIESAQRKVESRNFEARKNVLDYDDVMNQQREVIYAQRHRILTEGDCHPIVEQMAVDLIKGLVGTHCPDNADAEEWNRAALLQAAEQFFLPAGRLTADALAEVEEPAEVQRLLLQEAAAAFAEREKLVGPEGMRQFERDVLLRVVNAQWVEHLDAMDDLREGVGLRAYGQLDPLTQYKIEAYEMFEELVQRIREDAVRYVYTAAFVQLTPEQVAEWQRQQQIGLQQALAVGPGGGAPAPAGPESAAPPSAGAEPTAAESGASVTSASAPLGEVRAAAAPFPRPDPAPRVPSGPRISPPPSTAGRARKKVARNDPCPCGSGKKYKHCHGR